MLLLVDAANVVGARPDGWWRDRPGAAARLVGRLEQLPGTALAGEVVERVVVVLEGRARAGAATTGPAPVQVVHAEGSADDALEALCRPGSVLVTADRALRARASAAGARTTSPRRLLEALHDLEQGWTCCARKASRAESNTFACEVLHPCGPPSTRTVCTCLACCGTGCPLASNGTTASFAPCSTSSGTSTSRSARKSVVAKAVTQSAVPLGHATPAICEQRC